jgi:multidrug efflux pump subunit AcrA (membrane-fusion protein)
LETEKNRTGEIRSEAVQEILSFVPHWIIRWGITVIFFTIAVILVASWFVHYPDIVQSRITLTTKNPPVAIIARTTGRFIKFANENETVKKGTTLGYIESTAEFKDISQLMKQVNEIELLPAEKKYLSALSLFNKNLKLGDMESEYLAFIKALNDYQFYLELNFYTKQIEALNAQILYYEKLNNNLVSQSQLHGKELVLAQRKFTTDSTLAKQNVISASEADKSESAFLQKKQSLENANSNIIHNQIQVAECNKKIAEFELKRQEAEGKYLLDLDAAFKRLKNQLEIWKQQYLFETPVDGKVSFSKMRSNNEFINSGENVMSVVPGSPEIIGLVQLPVYGSGKVKCGQKVNIKFDNYPYTQYGVVTGKVVNISEVPKDNYYSAEIALTTGLVTSYKKNLSFKQEMRGSAEIVTDDQRLLERIFNRFRALKEDVTK